MLISMATLVVFDAATWHSAVRLRLLYEANIALAAITSLDWTWG